MLKKPGEKINVAIGIIATPGEFAQNVADQLINCGVRSILNFAPVLLKNVKDIQISPFILQKKGQLTVQFKQQRLRLRYQKINKHFLVYVCN